MAVVKSMAYGHGAVPVARALADEADALAVARMEEGVALRDAGLETPIVVLEGPTRAEHLEIAFNRDLQLTFHHASQLPLLREYADEPIDCWLKLDSGMHRLGFPVEEAARLFEQLSRLPAVASLRLMTHLACADDLSDGMTERQLQRFHAACAGLDSEASVANSAGVLAWPQTHADWVRPGLMLYGASPVMGKAAAEFDLRPVMTLKASLIAIKPLQAGDPVGYGATWKAPEAMPMGVVAIGYGDGYPRHIGGDGQVLLNGKRVPVVGRVSMDMITLDLRGVEAQVGDSVILWGEGLPADEVAAWANTIPYTLFCGVTGRVERRYRD
jgi:alanine racemase